MLQHNEKRSSQGVMLKHNLQVSHQFGFEEAVGCALARIYLRFLRCLLFESFRVFVSLPSTANRIL